MGIIKNLGRIAVIICFIVPIAAVSVFSFIKERETFSERENRPLEPAPAFSFASLFAKERDERYVVKFERFYSDNFPLRKTFMDYTRRYNVLYDYDFFPPDDDEIVTLDAGNRDTQQVSASGDYTYDDYLPDEGTGMVIYRNRAMESYHYYEPKVADYTALINRLYTECGEVPTYIVIPPCAYELYMPGDKRFADGYMAPAYDYLRSNLKGPKLVELQDVFEEHKNEYIYFKTDHHWTALGAYYAYAEFIRETGGTPPELTSYKTGVRTGFFGSLYNSIYSLHESKALDSDADILTYYIPNHSAAVTAYTGAAMDDPSERGLIYPDYDETTNLYLVYMGGDIAVGVMRSSVKNGKSVMVVRDSYGHAFIPFLADSYEYVYMVEPRYLSEENPMVLADFMEQHGIGELVFLNYALPSVGGYWMVWNNELAKLVRP